MGTFQYTPYILLALVAAVTGLLLVRYAWRRHIAQRTVINNMREGMIVLDLEHRIVDVNAAARKILQIDMSKPDGRSITDFIADGDVLQHLQNISGDEEIVTELAVGEGNFHHYYELRISPLYSRRRQLRGRIVVLHNMTRQKTAEADLLNQKLLFQNLVAVARAATERPTIEATLQNTLDVAVKLTQAELGSLFVLGDNNVVTNGIFSRGEMTPLQQQEVVGRVMDQGLAGWVVRHKKAALIEETLDDERWLTLPDAPYEARSVIAVPMLGIKSVFGILTLQHSVPNYFNEEDLKLMQASADQIALALRNARIYDDQLRLAKQQAVLYETLRKVSSHVQPGTVAHVAAETVADLTGWTAVAILVPDEAQTNLVVRAASGVLTAAEGRQVPISKSICGQAFIDGRTRYVADVSIDENYVEGYKGMKSELAVPIMQGGQRLGVLDLESECLDDFSEEDIRLAESLAEAIGLALDNAHLFRVVEDERSRLQALIQSSRDGIVLVGMDQQILVMNNPAHELLHLPDTPEDWVNRSVMVALAELFEYAPLAAQATMAGVKHLNQGEDPPTEGEIEVPPHTIRWLNLPVRAGNVPLGRLLALRDVTEERLVEQARGDLTHTMVHDLRNPLNNIYGAQELISDLGPLNDDQEQLLDVAKDSTERMLALVNAILDISRLESGHMPMERRSIPIKNVIAHVVENQKLLANSKDIQVSYDIPADLPQAYADNGLIERVLINLIGNALKFTPLGGEVFITAGVEDDEENELFVCVQDTGHGIPASVKDRLFQKFATGKQTGSGSGLGLAFCKMVIEAHDGRIWAKSWEGEGAAFNFTLPIATIHTPRPTPKSGVSLFQVQNRYNK